MKRYLACMLAVILFTALFCSCGGSAGSVGGSSGIDWPKNIVTVVVPYASSGDTDTYCRALCEQLTEELGVRFVVANTIGGSGVVAATSVLDAKNDGYTVLFHHTGVMLTQDAAEPNQFSFLNDFEICATVARDDTYMLVVKKNAEYQTLGQFVDYCRAHPGEVRYSITYNGATHAVATLMEQTMGIDLDTVNVGSSAADRLTAFLAGECDCLVTNYMNVKNYIESGDFTVLGVCAEERPAGMEDFPTMKEQGYDVVQSKLYEVRFPKGTDQAVVDKLAGAIEKVTASEEFRAVLKTYYAEPFFRSGADTKTQDAAEVEALRKLFE